LHLDTIWTRANTGGHLRKCLSANQTLYWDHQALEANVCRRGMRLRSLGAGRPAGEDAEGKRKGKLRRCRGWGGPLLGLVAPQSWKTVRLGPSG
jgi:hypothetical protein